MVSVMSTEWSNAPDDFAGRPGEVDVYRIDLEPSTEVEQSLRAALSPDEIIRADRFIRKEHRTRFAVGRGVLRYLLGRYCSLDPGALDFCYGEFGKPGLQDSSSGISFNVSNTGALGVIAVTADSPVGIDVEGYRERLEMDKIARRFFAPEEVEALFGLDAAQRTLAFYRCWSSKEAFMKVCGRGLSLGLSRFQVEVDPSRPPRVVQVPEEMGDVDQWEMAVLPMQSEVSGILAVEGQLDKVELYRLDPASLL